MVRLSFALFSLLAVMSLSSCTLEGFDVEACELGDTIGFKIDPIDGWLRDYQPRPEELFVRVADSRRYEDAVVWETRLSYENFDKRTSRRVIAYGQQIVGWEVQQPPKPLSKGARYLLGIADGGHAGWAEFELGKPLPPC